MAGFDQRVDRALAWFHRWAGIVLCLIFVLWFASGAVLHFVGFPSLPASERYARAETIDLSRVTTAPSAALAVAGLPDADNVRLLSVDQTPEYLISSPSKFVSVNANTGAITPSRNEPAARRIAEHFSGKTAVAAEGPFDYDQWIVHQQFDRARPFFRVRLNDGDATDLYVSARTGEVLQRTRARERMWNWCGAVLHWVYFTPVRKDWSLWDQGVWWVSLVALSTSAIGVWLGVIRMLATRKSGRAAWTPFRGWMRWHHLIGLTASVVVITWIFSGWLSMDHGRLFSSGDLASHHSSDVRGMSLASIADAATLERLRAAGPASELSLEAVASRALLSVRATDASRRVLWLDTGDVTDAPLPDELLLLGLRKAWDRVELIQSDSGVDRLYRLAESLPDDALVANVGAPDDSSRAYLDRANGRLIAVMDGSRRAYAWTYYALHTLNFPGLNTHPTLRTSIVVTLVLLGLAFSITGVIVGIRRLRLQFR